jgi:hypothetical protein
MMMILTVTGDQMRQTASRKRTEKRTKKKNFENKSIDYSSKSKTVCGK